MNYLQSEKNYTILHSISKILKQNSLESSESLSLLADKSINKTGWTSVLLDAFDNRNLPVYTSELITRINTAHHREMTQENSSRKKLIDHLENGINLRRKFLNDTDNDFRRKHTELIRATAEHDAALANHLDRAEIDKLYSHKQSVTTAYYTEQRLFEERHQLLQNELTSLKNQLQPISLLPGASNQRLFFLTSEDHNMG